MHLSLCIRIILLKALGDYINLAKKTVICSLLESMTSPAVGLS